MKKFLFAVLLLVLFKDTNSAQYTRIEDATKITEVGDVIYVLDKQPGSNDLLVSSWNGLFSLTSSADTKEGYTVCKEDVVTPYNINAIAVNNSNELWISHANLKDSGYIEKATIERPNNRMFTGGQSIRKVVFDEYHSMVWIGTLEGLYKTDLGCEVLPEDPVRFSGKRFISEPVYDIVVDGSNRKWFATSKGIYTYDDLLKWQFLEYKNGVRALTMFQDEVWCAGIGEVFFFQEDDKLKSKNIKRFNAPILFGATWDVIRDIWIDDSGLLLIASNVLGGCNISTPDDVFIWDAGEEAVSYLNHVATDSMSNIWISTINNGLFRIDKFTIDSLMGVEKVVPLDTVKHLSKMVDQASSRFELPKDGMLLGKKIDKLLNYSVDTTMLCIKVADYVDEDGDVVKLYKNGQSMGVFHLTKVGEIINVPLADGINYLYAEAIDEGTRASATLSISWGENIIKIPLRKRRIDVISFISN